MLFGNEKKRNEIMYKAQDIAKTQNFELVFAAVQGSISRGLEREESDYDIRFLYKKKNNNIINNLKNSYKEEEVVYRYYPQEGTFYDKIAFWDINAFFSFLGRPELDNNGISLGLYNQVFWTLTSPYVWDPYGLVNKICPIANRIINKCWLHEYFIKYIEDRDTKEAIILRDYIYIVNTIWQMEWLQISGVYPPIFMNTLEFICDDYKIKKLITDYTNILQKKTITNIKIIEKENFLEKIERNSYIDSWLETKKSKFRMQPPELINKEEVQNGLNAIYKILSQIYIEE